MLVKTRLLRYVLQRKQGLRAAIVTIIHATQKKKGRRHMRGKNKKTLIGDNRAANSQYSLMEKTLMSTRREQQREREGWGERAKSYC